MHTVLKTALLFCLLAAYPGRSEAQEITFNELVDLSSFTPGGLTLTADAVNDVLFVGIQSPAIYVYNTAGTLNTGYGTDGILGNDVGEFTYTQAWYTAFDGTNLFVADRSNDLVYVVNPTTGALDTSIGGNGIIGDDTGGGNPEPTIGSSLNDVAVRDGVLYLANNTDVLQYQLDGSGGLITTFSDFNAQTLYFGPRATSGSCNSSDTFSGSTLLYAGTPNFTEGNQGPVVCLDASAVRNVLLFTNSFGVADLTSGAPAGTNCSGLSTFEGGEILYLAQRETNNELRCIGSDGNSFTSNDTNVGASEDVAVLDGFLYLGDITNDAVQVSSAALPVELVHFEAVRDGGAVALRWSTASETNNAGFEVQRYDAGTWQVLGFVEGRGTTLAAQAYSYRTEDVAPGTHRFRLRQLDYDGAFAYSPEVEVAVGIPGSYHLSTAYPNPFNPATTFTLTVQADQHVRVAVFDALGRRVAVLSDGPLTAGTAHRFTFGGATLPSGTYLLDIRGETFQATRTLVLSK